MDQDTVRDRFEGTLLGTMVGDALGMPVEGWDSSDIRHQFGTLREMTEARLGRGTYTDDTEMMIALADSLVRKGGIDSEDLAQSFLRFFHPERGYGAGTTGVLRLLRDGVPWQEATKMVFPGGSFGNGCAMRTAPVGAFYFQDPQKLKNAAYAQSDVTHSHPLAREGTYLQSLAIARLIRDDKKQPLDPLAFLSKISSQCSKDTPSFSKTSEVIETFLRKPPSQAEVIDRLGHDSRVIRSQPTALYSFLSHAHSFEDALIYSVNLGGDTDTIGAMTGALAGAYHGALAIPERWLECLENGQMGRDWILALAGQLYQKSTKAG